MLKDKKNQFMGLDKKILIIVLIICTFFTFVITSINVYFSYREEKKAIESEVLYIKTSIIPSLSLSIWHMDSGQSKLLISGLLANKAIGKIQVLENNNHLLEEINRANNTGANTNYEVINLPLLFSNTGEIEKIGILKIYLYSDYIPNKIKTIIFRTFVTQSIIVLVIAFFLMFVFRKLVTNSLSKISNYFKQYPAINETNPLLLLERDSLRTDELDLLEVAINNFIKSSKDNQKQILELKSKAEEINNIKNVFLANISHEFRTPLNAILGIIDVIVDAKDEDISFYLNIQKNAGLRLIKLVDAVLELTTIEAQEFKFKLENFSIFLTIKNAINILEMAFEKNKNIVVFHHSNNFPEYIFGDENRLEQIVLNLLTNANKHCENGILNINLYLEDKFYVISVKDTGMGMSPEKLEEVFEPFRQSNESLNLGKRGFGIGLSVARKIIQAQGGKIEVTSVLNKGTEFLIYLPLTLSTDISADKNSDFIKKSNIVNLTHSSEKILNILIVDDTEDNRILLKTYLNKTKHTTMFAENGEDAVSKFKNHNFDIVFMDIQMPVKDGLEATSEIRKFEAENNRLATPIIVISAYQQKSDIDKAMLVGCTDYLLKPIGKKLFVEYVQSFCE